MADQEKRAPSPRRRASSLAPRLALATLLAASALTRLREPASDADTMAAWLAGIPSGPAGPRALVLALEAALALCAMAGARAAGIASTVALATSLLAAALATLLGMPELAQLAPGGSFLRLPSPAAAAPLAVVVAIAYYAAAPPRRLPDPEVAA